MRSYIMYSFLCDRKKAPVSQTTVHELVETLVSHSTRVLSEQKLHNKTVQLVQDAHRYLHIFHENKHYWIFSQDGQIAKMFLAVFRWHFKQILCLCYTGVFFSVTKISVTERWWKWSSNNNSFFLGAPKYLAYINIELSHCTVFQVLQENCAVDIP